MLICLIYGIVRIYNKQFMQSKIQTNPCFILLSRQITSLVLNKFEIIKKLNKKNHDLNPL